MPKALKIITAIILVLAVIASGGMIFLMRGMDEVRELNINDVDLTLLPDGVYRGEFEGYRWSNSVEVTIENHAISDIQPVDQQDFSLDLHINELIGRILEEQTLAVDTVSGATVSSKAFLKAVEDALTE